MCYCYVWVFVAVCSRVLVFCDVMLHCWVGVPQCYETRYFLDLQGSSGPWVRNLYTSPLLHLTCSHFHWGTDWSDLACISLPHIGILHEPLNPWRWAHWCSITSRRLESFSVTCISIGPQFSDLFNFKCTNVKLLYIIVIWFVPFASETTSTFLFCS